MDGAFLGEEFDGSEELRGVEYVGHGDASAGSEELYRGAVGHEAPVDRLAPCDGGGRAGRPAVVRDSMRDAAVFQK